MQYNLFEILGQFKDSRRSQGLRYPLKDVLALIVMAILSGHQGLRGFARFARSNSDELKEVFGFKHGVPTFGTIREVLEQLNEALFVEKFMGWVKSYHASFDDSYIALDGKAVRSTTNGGQTKHQNFVAVVSAFGHQSGLVYGMQSYENGKSSECQALRDLVAKLELQDKVFTVDALHSKKTLLT